MKTTVQAGSTTVYRDSSTCVHYVKADSKLISTSGVHEVDSKSEQYTRTVTLNRTFGQNKWSVRAHRTICQHVLTIHWKKQAVSKRGQYEWEVYVKRASGKYKQTVQARRVNSDSTCGQYIHKVQVDSTCG
jgi:hypothetical protein